MKYISGKEEDLISNYCIGGKAKNLFRLLSLGMNVPEFIVIPQEVLQSLITDEFADNNRDKIISSINQINISCNEIENIVNEFPGTKYFAVRSSAIDEDGEAFSFAGQFESFLFVREDTLAEKIKSVWKSAFSNRVFEYRKANNINQQFGLAVIVQRMIDAETSGVAFGINPVTGNTNEKFISSVFGLGEGIVSGELNADNFIVSDGKITSQLAEKTHKVAAGLNGSTEKVLVKKEQQKLSSLNNKQVFELAETLDKLFQEYKKPQDIEFAFKDGQLYILQTRAITTAQKFNHKNENYILWDNSNIIESYPGVTTPLTFSFISKSYEKAYKLFSGYMGVTAKTIKQNEKVFANTLGLINGRVYYNLKTWYHMLAMLPGYSVNARFMEKMMGVKERFDIPETYRLSKGKAWLNIIKMAAGMYQRFLTLPQKGKEFTTLLHRTISKYKSIHLEEKSAVELMQLYISFEDTLLNEWKAPLLNDFFAMIWFGLLQKRCEKYSISKIQIFIMICYAEAAI